MDQIYFALTDVVIPWVEDHYGRALAWIAAAILIALPLAAIVGIAVWLLSV